MPASAVEIADVQTIYDYALSGAASISGLASFSVALHLPRVRVCVAGRSATELNSLPEG